MTICSPAKKRRGEKESASLEEMDAAGCIAANLYNWKMISFEYDDEMPNFVFYVPNTDNAQSDLVKVANQVRSILISNNIELPNPVHPPRYSATTNFKDGKQMRGLYYAQGDGDWKDYLNSQGKLDTIYDKETNYATKTGNQILFYAL